MGVAPARLLESRRFADLVLRTLPRDCAIVLGFHRVGDDLPPWHAGTSPAELERILTAFARVAAPIALGELARAPVRGRRLAVTFDDGFADNAEIAAPLLLRLGIPAAFFLPTACIEERTAPWPDRAYARLLALDEPRARRLAVRLVPGSAPSTQLEAAHTAVHGLKLLDPGRRERVLRALPGDDAAAGLPMTWEQASKLAGLGFGVGSHGHTHSVLTTLDDDRLGLELGESRRLIEEHVGVACDAIGYPDDRHDERVVAAAAAAGYRLGFGGGRRVNVDPLEPLALERLSGEDVRIGAVALRLRRRPPAEEFFADSVGHYEDGRAVEYGFLTQARAVRRTLGRVRPEAVLDAGCGAGTLVPALEEAGASEIVGVDAEPGMVDAARRRWPAHRWLRADVRRLPFADGRFDACVSLGVLEYLEEPGEALCELARVVKPGGRVIVSVPQRRSPNDLGFRLAETLGIGLRERSRPLTESELLRALSDAGLRPVAVRATNFFAFPFDTLAPGISRRLAEALDGLGRFPGARRLGAQLIVEAVAEAPETVVWLVPALPTGTTFLDRELDELRRTGVPVDPLVPRIGLGALRTFLRRPLASAATIARLQLLKAPLDRERGRSGYLALALKGMTLADALAAFPRPGPRHVRRRRRHGRLLRRGAREGPVHVHGPLALQPLAGLGASSPPGRDGRARLLRLGGHGAAARDPRAAVEAHRGRLPRPGGGAARARPRAAVPAPCGRDAFPAQGVRNGDRGGCAGGRGGRRHPPGAGR